MEIIYIKWKIGMKIKTIVIILEAMLVGQIIGHSIAYIIKSLL